MIQHVSTISMSNTRWRNPTSHPVMLRFHMGPGQPDVGVTIPPGATGEVWSMFDEAVQRVKDGVIVGGMAPQLVREGSEPLPLHQAIHQAIQLGEQERLAAKMTGVTGGARHLDMGMALQMQLDELKADLAKRTASAEEAAEDARKMAQEQEQKRQEAEAAAAKAKADAEAREKAKDAEIEALRRQLLDVQTTPSGKGK